MRNLIKIIVCLVFCALSFQESWALSLESREVLFINSISRFLDVKPEGAALKPLEEALRSSNPCVKGLGALILYRHFGRQFKRVFQTSITMNQNIDRYVKEDKKFIKLEHVNKILADLEVALGRIRDDRVRRLFLFYHFRNIDLWLLGQSGEKLSLAAFYRISSLDAVFGPGIDSIKLAARADVFGK